MSALIQEWLKPGVIIPLINTGAIVVVFAWFTKTNNEINNNMSQLNGMMGTSYKKFQEDLEKLKKEEVNNIKSLHEIEEKKIGLELHKKDNEIDSLKKQIEHMEKTTSDTAVKSLLSIKESLEQTIKALKHEKNTSNLQPEIDNIQTEINNKINNSISDIQNSIKKYASRIENSREAAKWLKSSKENISQVKSNIPNTTQEEADSFMQDITDYINWICSSLENGGNVSMYGLGISTHIPIQVYVDVFNEIRNNGRKYLHEKVVEELEIYLDRIIESINK